MRLLILLAAFEENEGRDQRLRVSKYIRLKAIKCNIRVITMATTVKAETLTVVRIGKKTGDGLLFVCVRTGNNG